MTFASLGLSDPLARAVADLGYKAPTPVQLAAIPAILSGVDVWASAQTGSGKTAAFILPIVQRLEASPLKSHRQIRALVLVPTRELAVQIGQAIGRYQGYLLRPLKACVAVGGGSINPQLLELRGGADILVATPGRLLDLVEHNAVKLASLETLVLDEADRLLSLGFAKELGEVLALLPARCQKLLFSATFPAQVRHLADGLLHEPTAINVDAGAVPVAAFIQQRAIEVDAGRRTSLLRQLIAQHAWSSVLVFVASQYGAEHVAAKLAGAGLSVTSLHGDLSQGARSQALEDFKAGRVQILVATDVAARGLDIVGLAAVVNYDLPRSAADYLHRIGRTGRAGEAGVALSFISADSDGHFSLIERRHQLALPREQIPGFERAVPAEPARDAHGGVKGKRKSKKDKLREAAAQAARVRDKKGPP